MKATLRLCLMFVWFGVLVPLGLGVTEAAGATLNVSTTAQLVGAIANAQAGDTIVLAPGVYQPLARLVIDVNLTIKGDPSAPSIIDGDGEDIFKVLADDVRLENLTLRNGRIAIALGSSGQRRMSKGSSIAISSRRIWHRGIARLPERRLVADRLPCCWSQPRRSLQC